MKTLFKRILALMLVICMLALCSCSFFGGMTEEEEPEDDNSPEAELTHFVRPITGRKFYIAEPNDVATLVCEPYTDGINNYFILHLGQVRNSLLYAENALFHQGYIDVSYEWSESTSYATSVSKALTKCVKESVDKTVTAGISSELTAGVSAGYGGVSANVSASVKASLEASLGYTEENSYEQSSTVTVTDMTEKMHKQSFTIGKDSPIGFYRYGVYATVDVYAAVVCNIKDQTYHCEYYSLPQDGTYWSGFVFFEDSYFDPPEDEKLTLDPTVLDGMNVYSAGLPNYKGLSGRVADDDSERTITHVGIYGLEQGSKATKLDMSAFNDHFSSDFTFEMTIVIDMKRIDDGYQEVYLYNKQAYMDKSAENDPPYETVVRDYGLVTGHTFESPEGRYEKVITLTFTGDRCADTMYLQYDSHGNKDDDWKIYGVTVDVNVKRS